MPENISVKIPIKPVLKKYLQKKSIIHGHDQLRFRDRHPYNILLIDLVLNYNYLKSIPIVDKDNVISHFRSNTLRHHAVEIQLPYNNRKNILSHNYLSGRAKIKFRKFVWSDFIDEFILYMHTQMRKNVPRTKICLDFMAKYDLTENDIKAESLYRLSTHLLDIYDRSPKQKKQREKKINSVTIMQNLSEDEPY